MNNIEKQREVKESECSRLTLRKDNEIIGQYLVYDIETSLGIPHRATLKNGNYVVDLCWLDPFGIESEID